MMIVPSENVVAFPGAASGSMNWQILTIGNAARAAAQALASVAPAIDLVAEATQAEAQLAADAAELCGLLGQLAHDLDAMRQHYR
jgi:hypothetical protein